MQEPYAVWRQYFLPQKWLTWGAGKLAHCTLPWFKDWAIRRFIRLYEVDLSQAERTSVEEYVTFHDFFTRQLKPSLRPIEPSPLGICSPCDGTISQIGAIKADTLVQAKNRHYTLRALLGEEALVQPFIDGHYLTIYLAPHDYHRIHMPFTGTLLQQRAIPGKLFSVNQLTAKHVDQLFARNERVVTLFKSEYGEFALILVGAMLVGNITTRWNGVQPQRNGTKKAISYPVPSDRFITLDKGEEMGYFSLGSTVIALFSKQICWEEGLTRQSKVVLGQRIGQFLPISS